MTTTVNEPAGYDPRDWYSLDEVNAYRDGYNDAEEKFTAERTTPTDHEPGVVADELQAAMPGMPVADYATVPMVTLLRVLNTLRALAAERAIGAEVLVGCYHGQPHRCSRCGFEWPAARLTRERNPE